ncbi:hypothetical protein B0H11DRAFT_1937469 [Mycena galericulata]|nr:hypothetical protein B0H11DRAFT_1937469 [Mycena galericulata]
MPANEDDLAWWALVTEGVAEEKHVEAKIIRDLDVFTCGICLETLYMPVMPLCMHAFCYKCLLGWLKSGKDNCPIYRQSVEKPIRDNGFEMALWDAICSGLTASTEMEGKTVAGKVHDYDWAAVSVIWSTVSDNLAEL